MKTLAFIPARGGSKRLEKKNLKNLAGKPLIAHSIIFAQKCGMDKIVVSTDDENIAKVAREYDAEVIMRPDFLSHDTATTGSAAKHALEEVEKKGFNCDVFVTLQPTNPLRTIELWQKSFAEYQNQKVKSLITVSENDRKLGVIKEGEFKPINYESGQRSQDLPKTYYENGLIYLTSPDLIRNEIIFDENAGVIIENDMRLLIDIDYLAEFELAEFLYKKYSDIFGY